MIQYTLDDIGCYFDGAYGFEHNGLRLLAMAGWHGFKSTPINLSGITFTDDDYEQFIEEVNDAETFLNEHTTRPDNTYWSWEDGDFGLWQYDEEGELL
tara:strand:+ start:341 stop:634 length:294 start_codon:yes stop_codon:yes gene_type:complete